jgi:ABC-2 type transport system permease protein
MSDDGGDGSDEHPLAPVDEALLDQFTWYPLAKKEFQDTVRSKLIWVLSAVFIVVFALPAFLGLYFDIGQLAQQQGQTLTTDTFFTIATRFGSALVPIIAIVIGYASVAGERESGSLKVLLSLPFSRRDVLLGKVVGRGGVVAVPILLGFLVSVVVLTPTAVEINPLGFLLGSVLTALLGVVFVGLAVGFSAAASTSRRAIVGTVGLYIYFFLFWNTFANGVGSLLRRYLDAGAESTQKLSLFLKLLNPTQSYQTLVTSALGRSPFQARLSMFSGFRRAAACEPVLGGSLNQTSFECTAGATSLPIYYSDPAVLVYLLLWLAIPLLVGYRLFDAADL